MAQTIAAITLVVDDYDRAIAYYVGDLGFVLKSDKIQTDGKRWVTVSPPGASETSLLLAQAASDSQMQRIGDQTGGRVFLFLSTDDFERDYNLMRAKGVSFLEPPRSEPYGKVVVFADPFGNKWDLIESKSATE